MSKPGSGRSSPVSLSHETKKDNVYDGESSGEEEMLTKVKKEKLVVTEADDGYLVSSEDDTDEDNDDVDTLVKQMNMMMSTFTATLIKMKKKNKKEKKKSHHITIEKHSDKHENHTDGDSINDSSPTHIYVTRNTVKDKPLTYSTEKIVSNKAKFTIPTFNGSKINIGKYNAYKIKLKQYIEYYNISQNNIHMTICNSLTDDALIWYLAYVEAHPTVATYEYEQVMTILDKEYLNPLSKAKYRFEYEQMKSRPEESIQDLVKRINNLATQAGIILRTPEEKKNKLYSLLPLYLQELQATNLLNPSVDYDEFVSYVTQVKDINDKRFQQRKIKYPHTTNNINIDNHENNSLNNINHNNHNSRFRSGKNNFSGSCEYCHRTNHPTVNCCSLFRDRELQKPEALKFWNQNKIKEKLIAYSKSSNSNNINPGSNSTGNNTAANNNSPNANNSTSSNIIANISNNDNSIGGNETANNISSNSSKPLIYITGSINNLPVSNILLDEGSQFSLISKNFYSELLHHSGKSLCFGLSKNNLPVLKQADGKTPMKIIGSLKLDLKFENIDIGNFSFIIADGLSHEAIIGRDITTAANISTINDNGTKIIKGLNLLESEMKLPDNANIFSVRDNHIKSSKKIIANISAIVNQALSENSNTEVLIGKNSNKELPEHLREIIISHQLDNDSRGKLISILNEYQDVFYKPGDPINKLNTDMRHTIRLVDNAEPVQAKLYSLPLAQRQAISEQVNKWLKLGIIKPSYSPWSATCVVVDKKDQKLGRVCGNFQPLNKLTVNDAYPIKKIDDQKESFNGCTIFSSIDLKDAYLQIELDEKSKELTSIVTHEGLFQFERMIQGLKTAPATFHRVIDHAFKDVINKSLAPYFDDLTVHSKNIDEHLNHLVEVFEIMRKFGFKAKSSKVQLCVKELNWLGFIVSNGEIKPDPRLVSSIEKLSIPRNVNEVRMVTGLFNFYRSFIPKFAERCAPLDKLKRNDIDFDWQDEQQNAFDDLKNALMHYPVLRLPDMNKPFILDTDASTIGIGGILQQQDEITKKNYVVSYYSRKLSDAERKLGITDLEALALRDSIRKFNKYLIGQRFTIYVDHISLTYLQKLSTLSGKLGRISIDLQQYDYEIKYKPGSQHLNVDCLSRMSEDNSQDSVKGEVNNISINSSRKLLPFKQIQESDTFIMHVINYLNGNKFSIDEELEGKIKDYLFSSKKLKFELHNGILKVNNIAKKNNDTYQIIIPDTNEFMKLQLAQSMHNPTHCGRDTLYKLISSKFYWTDMKNYLNNFVDSCTVCQKVKRNYHNDIIEKKIILNQSEKNNENKMLEPFSEITIDHLDLPTTDTGYTCVLVIIDRATRLIKAIPCKSHDTIDADPEIDLFREEEPAPRLIDQCSIGLKRMCYRHAPRLKPSDHGECVAVKVDRQNHWFAGMPNHRQTVTGPA